MIIKTQTKSAIVVQIDRVKIREPACELAVEHTRALVLAALCTSRTRNSVSILVYRGLCECARERGGWRRVSRRDIKVAVAPLGLGATRVAQMYSLLQMTDGHLQQACNSIGNARLFFSFFCLSIEMQFFVYQLKDNASLSKTDEMKAKIAGIGEKLACVLEVYLFRRHPAVVVDSRCLLALNALGLIRTVGGWVGDRWTYPSKGW